MTQIKSPPFTVTTESGSKLWTGIDQLLCDSEGVELFTDFLQSRHSLGHLVDFWFACKGFRLNVDPTDLDKLFQVAKVIYRTYVKFGALYAIPLPSSLRNDVVDRMASYHENCKSQIGVGIQQPPISSMIDRYLFDDVQQNVKHIMENKYFPKFLDFLQTHDFSFNPKCCYDFRKNGVQCGTANQVASHISSSHPYELEAHLMESCWDTSTVQTPFNVNMLVSSAKPVARGHHGNKMHPSTVPSSCYNHPSNKIIDEFTTHVANSRHSTRYLNRKEVSITSDRGSSVSRSISNREARPRSQPPSKFILADFSRNIIVHDEKPTETVDDQHMTRSCITTTKAENGGVTTFSQGLNLAETDPIMFVSVLTSRLEKVRESRVKMENLMSRVNQIDDRQSTSQDLTLQPPSMSDKLHLIQASESPSHYSLLTFNNNHPVDSINKPVLMASSNDTGDSDSHGLTKRFEEDPQGILDYHCSRIWADEYSPNDIPPVEQGRIQDPVMVRSCLPYIDHERTLRKQDEFGQTRPVAVVATCSSRRRRTATSATGTSNSTAKTSHHHRRPSIRKSTSHAKPTHSDACSSTSWDSGVVDTNLAHVDLNMNIQGDLETRSVVAAASLQALSSSATELALLNSDVTAKLVARINRQHNQRCKQDQLNLTAESQQSPYRNYDLFYPLAASPLQNQSSITAPYPTKCLEERCPHCTQHQHWSRSGIMPNDLGWVDRSSSQRINQKPLSDTSSTLDSGISSAYDHLPIGCSERQRNHNHDFRNWSSTASHGKKHSATIALQTRAPSVPHSHGDRNNMHFINPYRAISPSSSTNLNGAQHLTTTGFEVSVPYPNSCACNCYRLWKHTLAPSSATSDIDTPKSARSSAPPKPSQSGRLLQHWLQLQSPLPSVQITTNPKWTKDRRSNGIYNNHRRVPPIDHPDFCPHTSDDARPSEFNSHCHGSPDPIEHSVITTTTDQSPGGIIVGYYLCDDPVPYRTVWLGTANSVQSDSSTAASLTLGQFKQLIAKKGVYRYFFKKPSDEFGTGVVHEELSRDEAILPLWDGKVVARIERAD